MCCFRQNRCRKMQNRGEKIRVFLYKDSKDRLIATTNTPKLTLGEYAPLVVKEVGKIGAFLDWGLEKRSVSAI